MLQHVCTDVPCTRVYMCASYVSRHLHLGDELVCLWVTLYFFTNITASSAYSAKDATFVMTGMVITGPVEGEVGIGKLYLKG